MRIVQEQVNARPCVGDKMVYHLGYENYLTNFSTTTTAAAAADDALTTITTITAAAAAAASSSPSSAIFSTYRGLIMSLLLLPLC